MSEYVVWGILTMVGMLLLLGTEPSPWGKLILVVTTIYCGIRLIREGWSE